MPNLFLSSVPFFISLAFHTKPTRQVQFTLQKKNAIRQWHSIRLTRSTEERSQISLSLSADESGAFLHKCVIHSPGEYVRLRTTCLAADLRGSSFPEVPASTGSSSSFPTLAAGYAQHLSFSHKLWLTPCSNARDHSLTLWLLLLPSSLHFLQPCKI